MRIKILEKVIQYQQKYVVYLNFIFGDADGEETVKLDFDSHQEDEIIYTIQAFDTIICLDESEIEVELKKFIKENNIDKSFLKKLMGYIPVMPGTDGEGTTTFEGSSLSYFNFEGTEFNCEIIE